uniref:ZSWIM1/3 RNaseH-like domain-containing protein n=1 Tax=Amphimedon queenslandica TaxID=400682 RepID=A0A1X7VUP0_AMPQE
MFMKFGGNAVCTDSTHRTNIYDYHLVTILVLDNFGEGISVAWFVLNCKNAAVLPQFLLKVKEKCGNIKTKVFMSDVADNFYNALKTVSTISETKN